MLLILFVSAWLAGGVPAGGQATPAEVEMALKKAEALWAAKKPATYEFTVALGCFCALPPSPPAFRVTNGVAMPVGTLADEHRRTLSNLDTVDKQFNRLREVLARKPYKIAVQFDTQWGYPVSADIDMVQHIADDEWTLRVTNFKPVK